MPDTTPMPKTTAKILTQYRNKSRYSVFEVRSHRPSSTARWTVAWVDSYSSVMNGIAVVRMLRGLQSEIMLPSSKIALLSR